MLGYQKVGGLTFIRIGRLSFSYCITRKPNRAPVSIRFPFPFPEIDTMLISALLASIAFASF